MTIDPKDWQVPGFREAFYDGRRAKFALCIFVINEGDRIRKQVQAMAGLAAVVDIVIADGGSSDGSLEPSFLQEHGVRALLVKTGPGKLSAQMRMALAWCLRQGYGGIVTIDGNGKDGIAAVPQFVKLLEQGYDHIQGSRYVPGGRHENTPFLRHWGVQLLHAPLISLAAGFRYTDTTNGFRGYSRKYLMDERVQPFRDVFQKYELHYYLAIRAARLGFRCCETPVSRVYPGHGKIPTKISPFKGNCLVLGTLFKAVMGCFNPSAIPVDQTN